MSLLSKLGYLLVTIAMILSVVGSVMNNNINLNTIPALQSVMQLALCQPGETLRVDRVPSSPSRSGVTGTYVCSNSEGQDRNVMERSGQIFGLIFLLLLVSGLALIVITRLLRWVIKKRQSALETSLQSVDAFQNLTNRLQAGLDFLPDDLEANERGVLSERQQSAVLVQLAKSFPNVESGCTLLIVALPLVFVALPIMLFIAVEGDMARALWASITGFWKQSNPYAWVIVLPLLIVVLAILNSIRILKTWRSEMRTLRTSPDRAVPLFQEGVAHRRWRKASRRSRSGALYIVINRQWLQVNVYRDGEYEAFQEGVAYRVYYVKLGPAPYLLSAKVVSNP